MARSNKESFPAIIIKAIQESGQSVYAVAKGAEVPQPVVHRFVAGERGLTLDTAEKLCRYLGLKLVGGLNSD